MKYAAIILNLLLLGTAVFLAIKNGAPNTDEYFIFFIIITAPIISLIALLVGHDKSLIGLYFKRKVLEEQKKIEKLQGNQ